MAIVGAGSGGESAANETVIVPEPSARLLTDLFDAGVPWMTVLGGAGFPLSVGDRVGFRIYGDRIYFMPPSLEGDVLHSFPVSELMGIEVTGPGTVTKGGGFIGGGFGIQGAAEGIAIAAALNAVTTKKLTATYLRIEVDAGELFLHCPLMEPFALRIFLSPLFVEVRRRRVDTK